MCAMKSKPLSAFLILLLLGIIWGTGYSIARYATTNGVSPLGYSFWQSLGPALLIGFLCLLRPQSRLKMSVPHLRYYLICGLTGIVIPNTNMYFAAPHLPAGLLAVIVNTVPIIAYPMALLAGSENFNFLRLSGVLSAVFGIMLIIIPTTSFPFPHMNMWALSALVTPLSFAFCSVYIARFKPTGDSLSFAAGTLIASTLILLPLVLMNNSFYFFHIPLTLPDVVVLLEILLSSVGYILLFKLISMAGPVYYSLVDTIVALTGLFWGSILFHEQLNHWTLPAILFIFVGLILVTIYRRSVIEFPSPRS